MVIGHAGAGAHDLPVPAVAFAVAGALVILGAVLMDTTQSGCGGASAAACLGLGAFGTSGSRRSTVRSGRGP